MAKASDSTSLARRACPSVMDEKTVRADTVEGVSDEEVTFDFIPRVVAFLAICLRKASRVVSHLSWISVSESVVDAGVISRSCWLMAARSSLTAPHSRVMRSLFRVDGLNSTRLSICAAFSRSTRSCVVEESA